MSIRKRFRLFFNVIAMVAILVLAKAAIHHFGFEFLELDVFFPSVVASSIFIIGFLLSSILPDYKESERMPAEIRTALEGIHDDAEAFAWKSPNSTSRACGRRWPESSLRWRADLAPRASTATWLGRSPRSIACLLRSPNWKGWA